MKAVVPRFAEIASGLLWRQGSYSDPEPCFMRCLLMISGEPSDNDDAQSPVLLFALDAGKRFFLFKDPCAPVIGSIDYWKGSFTK
jgi:hypothetical protein